MPLFCRGLRDHLIRHAKDDGTLLESTDDPGADMATVMVAHRTEAKLVAEYIRRLIQTGFLSFEGGRLWMTNFVDAQSARSPGARRQKVWRERHRDVTETPSETRGSVTRDVTRDVTLASPDTLQMTRRDETRDPPSPPPGPEPRRQARPDPFLASMSGRRTQDDPDVIRVFEAWKLAHGFAGAKFREPADYRADTIREAIQTNGVEACLLVLEASRTDPMVTGVVDDKGQEHRTIGYLFKPDTFDRLLRAGQRARAGKPLSAVEVARRARDAVPDEVRVVRYGGEP